MNESFENFKENVEQDNGDIVVCSSDDLFALRIATTANLVSIFEILLRGKQDEKCLTRISQQNQYGELTPNRRGVDQQLFWIADV